MEMRKKTWERKEIITLLGVVLSSDKTNVLVMTGNHIAHPVLISLVNINKNICSKTLLYGYMLLALLPVTKFIHKNTQVHSLLQDHLFHQALNLILQPLKTAATMGMMMNDPVGNLWYCYTLLAAWTADTPKQGLLAGMDLKVSPVMMAKSRNFGDPFYHLPHTGSVTLTTIRTVYAKQDPLDYKTFLKVIRELGLNGILEPFWKGWLLSSPSIFLHVELLHHFHWFCWDHNCQWCITAMGAQELNFHFSLIHTTIGYHSFEDGISKLKQVTCCNHQAVQHYLVSVTIFFLSHIFFLVAVVCCPYFCFAPLHEETDHYLLAFPSSSSPLVFPL